MAGRKRNAPGDGPRRTSARLTSSASSTRRTGAAETDQTNAPPRIYRELLTEARVQGVTSAASGPGERPAKRMRPGERRPRERSLAVLGGPVNEAETPADDDDEEAGDEEEVEFEDVGLPAPTIQTITQDSDEDEEDGEDLFEDVAIAGPAQPSSSAAPQHGQQSGVLELNLTAHQATMNPRRLVERRKPITKEEKERRVEIHKMHVLCLLAHVELRNHWCNSPDVHEALRPLLSDKVVGQLNPRASLTQFGRTESLKAGIQAVKSLFQARFAITERGLRRALWAEAEDQLQHYTLSDDIESTFDKADIIDAARTLKGSRDVGAQLFCALLRAAGLETRLVCSLQPLACFSGAPTMPKLRGTNKTPSKPSRTDVYAAAVARYESSPATSSLATSSGSPVPSARLRLGHPNATAYHLPAAAIPPSRPAPEMKPTKRIRGESAYPVYWVEVLDVAHQKWQPVDPLVTRTMWKPQALEPPAVDRDNHMAYVVAFEFDGSARDVTRRYAKAYNSKTRKMRVNGLNSRGGGSHDNAGPALGGERWWRKTMRRYKRPPTDLDQIEDVELLAAEAREPMPRNVADFKDHPVYALVRHLRRNQVLVPGAQASGTVSAGSKAPLERIYRRKDVRTARSRDKWYRMGRVVRPGEEPVKWLPKPVRKKSRFGDFDGGGGGSGDDDDDEDDDDPDKVSLFGDKGGGGGTPIYTAEQTDAYEPPPVVGGRVPKNKFGNIDLYVPEMVPAGGVHIAHELAARAAFVLGVDYAPALTGFQFKGRTGTAVLSGAVVPSESAEGVWAAIRGLTDLEAEAEVKRRTARALRMWSRFLKGLRVRQRIWANVGLEEGEEEGKRGRLKEEEPDKRHKGKGIAKIEEGKEEEDDDDNDDEDDGVEKENGDVGMENALSDVSEEYFMEDDDEGGGFLLDDDGGGFVVE